jgi:23S rRNA (adenine2503-C2)-methyltransferase
MLAVFEELKAAAPEGVPTELSFTGEGEPLLNLKNVLEAVRSVPEDQPLRFSFSGVRAYLLGDLARAVEGRPARLQFSMHHHSDAERAAKIPGTLSLSAIRSAMDSAAGAFSEVAVNYVLMRGYNDSPEDADALAAWLGGRRWRVRLNGALGTDIEGASSERARQFAERLVAQGVRAEVCGAVARSINAGEQFVRLVARRSVPTDQRWAMNEGR